jgi:hypothetical protein
MIATKPAGGMFGERAQEEENVRKNTKLCLLCEQFCPKRLRDLCVLCERYYFYSRYLKSCAEYKCPLGPLSTGNTLTGSGCNAVCPCAVRIYQQIYADQGAHRKAGKHDDAYYAR